MTEVIDKLDIIIGQLSIIVFFVTLPVISSIMKDKK
jgi:hypothetical protein